MRIRIVRTDRAAGRLIAIAWLEKTYHGPQLTDVLVKSRGVRFHRIRDSNQCYFNSTPPTSHFDTCDVIKVNNQYISLSLYIYIYILYIHVYVLYIYIYIYIYIYVSMTRRLRCQALRLQTWDSSALKRVAEMIACGLIVPARHRALLCLAS